MEKSQQTIQKYIHKIQKYRKVIRDHCEQLYVTKMGNVEEMGKILRKA